jgi:hypothetical protein
MLHTMHVASVCFQMFQVFLTYLANVSLNVAYTCNGFFKCFRRMFYVFQLFRTYIAGVLSRCCRSKYVVTHVAMGPHQLLTVMHPDCDASMARIHRWARGFLHARNRAGVGRPCVCAGSGAGAAQEMERRCGTGAVRAKPVHARAGTESSSVQTRLATGRPGPSCPVFVWLAICITEAAFSKQS